MSTHFSYSSLLHRLMEHVVESQLFSPLFLLIIKNSSERRKNSSFDLCFATVATYQEKILFKRIIVSIITVGLFYLYLFLPSMDASDGNLIQKELDWNKLPNLSRISNINFTVLFLTWKPFSLYTKIPIHLHWHGIVFPLIVCLSSH